MDSMVYSCSESEYIAFRTLLLDRSWINQRVEQFEIENSSSYLKKSSITVNRLHFETLLESINAKCDVHDNRNDGCSVLVPLEIVLPEGLVQFDARDQNNNSLPVLSDKHSRYICSKFLADYIDENISEIASCFVEGKQGIADFLYTESPTYYLFVGSVKAVSERLELQISALKDEEALQPLKHYFELLFDNPIVIARSSPEATVSIIKFSYKVFDNLNKGSWLTFLGLSDYYYMVTFGGTYNFLPDVVKVAVPEGMIISHFQGLQPFRGSKRQKEKYSTYNSSLVLEVSSSAKIDPTKSAQTFPLGIFMQPESLVTLVSSCLVMTLMTLLQAVAGLSIYDPWSWNVEHVLANDSGSLTLLAVIPSLLAFFLVIPSEHRLVSALYMGQRIMMAIACILMFFATFLYTVGIRGGWMVAAIITSFAVSTITLVVLTASGVMRSYGRRSVSR